MPHRRMPAGACLLVLAGYLAPAAVSSAGQPDGPASLAFFESRIRPVLVTHCDACHSASAKQVRGGLRVDSRAGLVAGGDSGPAVVPGKPAESLLLAALRHDGPEMPPSRRLPAGVIQDFTDWIQAGAVDPRVADGPPDESRVADDSTSRRHWAFQPIGHPGLPEVKRLAWPLRGIDHFILAKLEQAGLDPAPDAGRATWLRRVSFDLVGLPPSPAAIDAFERDSSATAHEAVVDRLLESEHFGERFARHWLDVARFAESSGGGRSLVFREAWRYRDYVIDAFNRDLPVNRFITEQLAGDLLAAETDDQRARQLVATTYLLLGANNYEEQDKRFLEMNVIDEQLDAIGRGLLGLTLGCARCHDHKFDPIPAADYYAMAGILASTKTLEHRNVSIWNERPLPLSPKLAGQVAEHQVIAERLAADLKEAAAELARLETTAGGSAARSPGDIAGFFRDDTEAVQAGEWVGSTYTKPFIGDGYLHDGNAEKGSRTLTFQPQLPQAGRYEVRLAYTPRSNRATNVPITLLTLDGDAAVEVNMQKRPPVAGHFVSLGTYAFDRSGQWFVMVSNEGTDGYVVVDGLQFLPVDGEPQDRLSERNLPDLSNEQVRRARARVNRLKQEQQEHAARRPKVPRVMAVAEADQIRDCRLCIRGDVHNPGAVMPRGVLQAVTLATPPAMPADESGRRELAAWITDAEHPLTSRVFVNRIWQWLFGRGLVATPDNFGLTGSLPSHPMLLDYLARRLTEGGWSTKEIIREIVLSRTYRQAVRHGPAAAECPDSRLLAGVTRRRLDAESLRDAMLAVAGTLETRGGGPGIADASVLAKAGGDTPSEYNFVFADTRRSIYTPAFRNRRHELFEAFDAANPNAVVGLRSVSTVPTQSLYLLNSRFVQTQADAAAARILTRTRVESRCIEQAFRLSLGRLPSDQERVEVSRCLATGRAQGQGQRAGLAVVLQALFGCIDFRTLE